MALSVILAGLLQLAGLGNTDTACGLNAQAQKLASLIIGHESQQRTALQCNGLLAEIAARRALELVNDSNPDGLTPNEILAESGYRLASFYPAAGNQVEALASEVETPESALDYLVGSYEHRDLVLGNGEFFLRQSQLGVGYHEDGHGQALYVVLIAEPYSSPKVVMKQEIETPSIITKAKCGKAWRFSKNDELRKVCREKWLENQEEN